jgi:glycosyltransferase involved in cell wall biosynthesis
MRIGIAKVPTAFSGGFELLVARIAASLTARGHDVGRIEPDDNTQIGRSIPDAVRDQAPEYFQYVEQFAGFERATPQFDVVLSTQPPSQAVRHRRQVALFYHHLRQYYDLSDVWVAAGFADSESHAVCQKSIRRMDDRAFANTSRFLAGSETVKRRLERFNNAGSITEVLRAPSLRPTPSLGDFPTNGQVLCVSRHEFPKRTELAAAAMKLLPDTDAVFVGSGGRLGWVIAEDQQWSRMKPDAVAEIKPDDIWLRRHTWVPEAPNPESNVRFVGWATDTELEEFYRAASCVVAPAFDEDYGLTALEAMAHARPVVVCSDGGGLAETVVDNENGLVVEPDHNAIAGAIETLTRDPDLAQHLGLNGRRLVDQFDWTAYIDHIEDALGAHV